MEEKQTIKIKDEQGNVKEAEVVLYFTLNETGNRYLIYTFEQEPTNELVTVNAVRVIEDEEGNIKELKGIESDEEWTKIKEVMREVIKDSDNEEAK